ncbi:nitrogenase cofactor biosynthesis protein NifB|uniref:Nitrogen fixation protein NifB n=1 Tax=Dendrosporobacter quercicolus TaxID=146817 RepID=A0A1G9SJU5_9FIRM|nr:nitrogenase cofactor biosynthesis protein NifB [Dendrosporobacter quercicolus]NSL48692.1 nitrogenase cofactor biosynthesis protein NifB [Dendrosporobacter quercicolus DSM 1736]SDM35756.1 nitrogen fixation protein NifB [Dendrosporobacter quercicolus]
MENECSKNVAPVIPADLAGITAKHPCYSVEAHRKFARMHLPVAPVCNISCNYCNRKYDCVNESRPGVTSEVLTPETSLAKFIRVKQEIPHLSVVGIAGPGDALANWKVVKRSIELIKDQAADTIFCLSTNGLLLPRYGRDIIALGIKHVTVTVNCLEPAIGAKIYHHIYYQGRYYAGEKAAERLLHNQLEGIKLLTDHGILVKINIVMIKDINDGHIPEVVKKVKSLGALMTNIMPLIPAPGSVFQNFPQTSRREVDVMRDLCQTDLFQMRHCQQCRADAIGLLTEDRSHQFRNPRPEPAPKCSIPAGRYKVAVTSRHRRLVDLHYGQAEEFHIYETDGMNSRFVESRPTRKYCLGPADCDGAEKIKAGLLQKIADCDAVLTMRIGYEAQQHLQQQGIAVIESCDGVEEGLRQAVRQLRHEADYPGTACGGS